MNKELQRKLTQLLATGIALFLAGLFCLYILIAGISTFPIIYLPLTLLASLLSYLVVNKFDPGGQLNVYLTVHKKTELEKNLYELVKTNRSKKVILSATILFTTVIVVAEIFYHSPQNFFNGDDLLTIFSFTFLSIITATTGIKYVSAWWNFKKI